MRMVTAGLAAFFVGALGGPALAESTLDEIQDEEQPRSEITIQGPIGGGMAPPAQPLLRESTPPPPEPALDGDGPQTVPLPPAEANPGVPNGEDADDNIDVLDDPDAPPAEGAADDPSGPDDDDPIPNE